MFYESKENSPNASRYHLGDNWDRIATALGTEHWSLSVYVQLLSFHSMWSFLHIARHVTANSAIEDYQVIVYVVSKEREWLAEFP